MRPPTLVKLLVLGVAIQVILRYRRRRSRALRDARPWAADRFAGDPVPRFDEPSELQVTPLEVDAQPRGDAEAAQDLASLESEVDETTDRDAAAIAMAGLDGAASPRGPGDRHGAHTPAGVYRVHHDDEGVLADGQNWIEALEARAIEDGGDPDRELDELIEDLIDEEDVLHPPHAFQIRDTPVADHGSGGRRGL